MTTQTEDFPEPNSTCVVCGAKFYGEALLPNKDKEGAGLCSLKCVALHFMRQLRDPATKD